MSKPNPIHLSLFPSPQTARIAFHNALQVFSKQQRKHSHTEANLRITLGDSTEIYQFGYMAVRPDVDRYLGLDFATLTITDSCKPRLKAYALERLGHRVLQHGSPQKAA